MGIEEKFNENMNKWMQHCRNVAYSSLIKDHLNCESYKNIVIMGKETLPLIYQATKSADKNSYLRLCIAPLVGEIVGSDFHIPDEIKGRVNKMWEYTVNWLHDNT